MSDRRLVYSTDPKENINQKKQSSKTADAVEPKNHCIKMRIEKKSRGGKQVVVLYDLPDNPEYLKKLLKELKNQCACGGSLKQDSWTLEIQGDHREKIRGILEKKGFQVKG